MAFEREDAHAPRALLNLAPPFWGLPRLAAIIYTYCEQLQAAEDALWTLLLGVDVDTAERWALEVLARIVGEPALPEDTDALRTLVKGRIAVNRSAGTLVDLYRVCEVLGITVEDLLEYQLEIACVATDFGSNDPAYVARVLDEAAMATVRVAVVEAGTFVLPDLDLSAPDDTWYPDLGLAGPAGTWSDRHDAA